MGWEMAPSKLHLGRPIQPTVVMTITIMILVFSSLPSAVHSIIFDLQSGRSKCVSEDLRNEAMSHGLYRIALDTPHTHKISVRVSGPYGDNMHQTESVDSGQFAFTAGRSGPHTVCFWTPQFELSTVFPVEFEWKSGVAAKDWSDVAKKGKVNMVELELRKLEETVHSIHEEMMFLREREEEMQNLNQKTNSRMASLSLLSLFICLAVASLQLWYLKSFFERKKIL
ncbi:hypothetical protein MRB53_009367 [Persea americana]|uniref:Uncharacterized protein n=1 Tax=Persea americana TaxID=3435 RepID=A0ACC2LNU0_PERAE|nr:hypothetical protein MRB53_009367 [Persea americana]